MLKNKRDDTPSLLSIFKKRLRKAIDTICRVFFFFFLYSFSKEPDLSIFTFEVSIRILYEDAQRRELNLIDGINNELELSRNKRHGDADQ